MPCERTARHEQRIVRRIFDRHVLTANARQGSMSLFPFPFHQKIFFRFFRELRRIPVRCHPAVSVSTCFAVLCGSFRAAIPILLYSQSAIVVSVSAVWRMIDLLQHRTLYGFDKKSPRISSILPIVIFLSICYNPKCKPLHPNEFLTERMLHDPPAPSRSRLRTV